jgi:sugar fermentation stimulation protein A
VKFNSTLQVGSLIRRYKRFLADVQTENGQITIHCPNTGSMTGCATVDDKVWYSTSDTPKRKYPNTWEISQTTQGHWLCINTTLANHVVKEAIENKQIPQLSDYNTIRSEVKYGEENSRIDLLLQEQNKADCYIEVKSVTLLSQQDGKSGQGYFPDAVSTRGQKHLRELASMAQSGHRAILFFLVQHSGIEKVNPARHIDVKYGELLSEAIAQGVEVIAYRTKITPEKICIDRAIEFSPI